MNEEYKYEMIKQLSETNSNKKDVTIKLNCTIRTVYRLLTKYKLEDTSGFLQGNSDKKSSTTIHNSIKQRIIDLYIDDYGDTNFTHFCETVNEDLGHKTSDTTLIRWLKDEGVIFPKAKRKLINL